MIICILLGFSMLLSTETYAKKNEVSVVKEKQKKSQKQLTKEFIGRGDVTKEKERQKRSLSYSSLEPTSLYAKQGDVLTIDVNKQDSLVLVVGTPERNKQKKYSLKQGKNIITTENEGAIYITNPNNTGSSLVTIKGATGKMPYFDLSRTSTESFQTQMATNTDAKDVQLVSKKAIITISYKQAKKHIANPKVLMEYYDRFLIAQDRVSGITSNGRLANAADRHFQHFIEVPRMYMFATQEYMGFNGDAALARLLKTGNGWGIWHESGHQRQQHPWKWSSVTESTVNIYSMAAQREITGSVNALDKYYPQMYTYLNSKNKDFEKQNNDLKMVLFGQLSNTFGENFYPVLHQYYRENNISSNSNPERIQNFVINVSIVTGYNMVPYFEQWGFHITESTRTQTNKLLTLPEKIWLNDNKTNKQLPLRLMDKVSLSDEGVKVNLTKFETNIFQGQKMVLIKNGKYVSELTNKKPYYSRLKGNVWESKVSIAKTDRIRIEVRNSVGTHRIYNTSIVVEQLKDKLLQYLNSKDSLSEVLNQSMLDNIRIDIGKISDKTSQQMLFNLLDKLEKKYLEALVKNMLLTNSGDLSIEFTNTKFKKYAKIVVLGTDQYIAEIANGKPYYSRLTGNILQVSLKKKQESFAVQFRLPHKTYTILKTNSNELALKREIENLFVTNNNLRNDITQKKIDDLRARISVTSEESKKQLTPKIKYAQELFFESIVRTLDFKNHQVIVDFSNDLYKNYKVVVLENKKYMAEITNGKPYYGGLKSLAFTANKKAVSGALYEVEIRHSSGTYKVKSSIFK